MDPRRYNAPLLLRERERAYYNNFPINLTTRLKLVAVNVKIP